MGIVRSAKTNPATGGEHLVDQIRAITAIRSHMAGVVIDFDRVSIGQGRGILRRQRIPTGMRNCDEGAGINAALGERRAGLMGRRRREIGRKPNGQDMPDFAKRGLRCVDLGTKNGREFLGSKGRGVDNRKTVLGRKWSVRARKSYPASRYRRQTSSGARAPSERLEWV